MYEDKKKSLSNDLVKSVASQKTSIIPQITYDPHQSPALVDLAIIHAKSNRIYKKDPNLISLSTTGLCPCCGLPVEGQLLPINCDLKELSHLGSGFVLYFVYYKYCMIILSVMISIFGIYAMISNISGTRDYIHSDALTTFYSLSAYGHSYDPYQFVLLVMLMVVLSKIFPYLRIRSHEIHQEILKSRASIADYSVQIRNIPIYEYTLMNPKGLTSFIHQNFPTMEVKKVVFASDSTELYNLNIELANEMRAGRDTQKAEELRTKIRLCKTERLKNLGLAFVTFNTTEQAEDFVRICKPRPYEKIIKYFEGCFKKERAISMWDNVRMFKTQVKVTYGPEPEDIEWENLSIPDEVHEKRKLYVSLASTVMALICAILVFVVQAADKDITDSSECNYNPDTNSDDINNANLTFTQQVINYLIDQVAGFVLVAFDTLQEYLCVRLTRHEGNRFKTDYARALSIRVATITFYCSAFSGFFAVVVAKMVLETPCVVSYSGVLFGEDGVIDLMSDVFVFEGIKNLVLSIIDIPHRKKEIKRKKALKNNGEGFTQSEAHEIFEGTETEFEMKYGSLTCSMFMAAVYAPLFPFAIFVTLIFTFAGYWVDKYKLLRQHNRPDYLGPEIEYKMIDLLKRMILWLWVGGFIVLPAMIVDDDEEGVDTKPVFVALCLGFATLLIIGEFIFPDFLGRYTSSAKNQRIKTYEEMKVKILTDYESENPFTRDEIFKNRMSSLAPDQSFSEN